MSSAATQFTQFLKTILYVNCMHVTLDDITLRVMLTASTSQLLCVVHVLYSTCIWYTVLLHSLTDLWIP